MGVSVRAAFCGSLSFFMQAGLPADHHLQALQNGKALDKYSIIWACVMHFAEVKWQFLYEVEIRGCGNMQCKTLNELPQL